MHDPPEIWHKQAGRQAGEDAQQVGWLVGWLVGGLYTQADAADNNEYMSISWSRYVGVDVQREGAGAVGRAAQSRTHKENNNS